MDNKPSIKKQKKSKQNSDINIEIQDINMKINNVNIENNVKTDDELLLESYNIVLKRHFNYDSLKPAQFEIIKRLLNKQDVFAILCTSFGKSITFQMVFLLTQKIVIVISPLISLMDDQANQMKQFNIPVCVLNSTNKNKNKTLNNLLTTPQLVYTSPEWIKEEKNLNFIRELYENELISLIAVDEAHLVSSWSDFRSSYDKLICIRDNFNEIPILALTATASEHIRGEIITKLKLRNHFMIVGEFDRPNLYLEINQRNKHTVINRIEDLINQYPDDHTIIYCKTKKQTEEVCESLKKKDINCEFYHGELTKEERDNIQGKVFKNELKCVIATIAYGQGINIPNVRNVIHYSITKNIENYYQEIGRGGRDGNHCNCVLFYENTDITIHRKQTYEMPDGPKKRYCLEQINIMDKYIHTKECRRKLLLAHFGEIKNSCTNCDNCINKISELPKQNYVMPVYLFLSVQSRLNGLTGVGIIINILVGSNNRYMNDEFKNYPEYGKGAIMGKKKYWDNVVQQLKNNEFIKQEPNLKHTFGMKTILTSKGNNWIRKIKALYPTYEILLSSNNVEELLW
jgi:RecQ family ATP-dependent DNA helicase